MAALLESHILLLGLAQVGELCAAASESTGEQIGIANYLCNGNYACSGSMAAVEKVMEIAKPEFKARMAVKLAVAGAFHTEFMAPAVSKLEEVRAAEAPCARQPMEFETHLICRCFKTSRSSSRGYQLSQTSTQKRTQILQSSRKF